MLTDDARIHIALNLKINGFKVIQVTWKQAIDVNTFFTYIDLNIFLFADPTELILFCHIYLFVVETGLEAGRYKFALVFLERLISDITSV